MFLLPASLACWNHRLELPHPAYFFKHLKRCLITANILSAPQVSHFILIRLSPQDLWGGGDLSIFPVKLCFKSEYLCLRECLDKLIGDIKGGVKRTWTETDKETKVRVAPSPFFLRYNCVLPPPFTCRWWDPLLKIAHTVFVGHREINGARNWTSAPLPAA